jgi:RNA polymerase subunit RPABC4/transcription elongation factor Spt4
MKFQWAIGRNPLGRVARAIRCEGGHAVNCGACGESIPADSMFCPECGSRQDMSVAGAFAPPPVQNIPPFPQQQRSFDPVSGQQQRMQQEANMNQMGHIPQDVLHGMAQGLNQHQNLPPGTYPQQPIQGGYSPQQGYMPQGGMMPTSNVAPMNDMPNLQRGPSIASGIAPNTSNVSPLTAGGTKIANNPANSPTDAMVNRLAEAERAVKDERRSQWLSMNQSPASSVLANLGGGELPSHLRGMADGGSAAADIMAGALGGQGQEAPNDALLRRLSEVAIRRVARKRGVAVEAPQTKLAGDTFEVNVTYVDDGRVLDSPEDLTHAFEQAIQTELALKGYDLSCTITMFRSKDGKTEKIGSDASEEDMFACEICDGLVKESDPTCPHCGAMFEDDGEEEVAAVPPNRGGPPGLSKSSGPPGPAKGGPPGPVRFGGPPGPSKSGPPGPTKSGGPPGPSKSGGPPRGGPGGGPPGPSKSGGPPGPSKSGGPPGPSKSGGPPGPSKSGGPPSGGPGGGPPGPSKSGGPPGPSKSGGPPSGGPGGGPPGPKKAGPPGGPKRGPPGR